MKLLLILQHKEYKQNFERWQLNSDGKIHVDFDCPTNYPPKGQHIMSPLQALRQFALMVSWLENWEIYNDSGWHDFVEKIIIKEK